MNRELTRAAFTICVCGLRARSAENPFEPPYKCISEVITENRRKPAVIGSGDWWKGVDALSQRRRSSSINLDNNFLVRLNDYFANLCYDHSYVKPIDMDIPDSVNPPEISER